MDALIDFLKSETLSHFIAEHHHDLLVLKKGATVQEAMKVRESRRTLCDQNSIAALGRLTARRARMHGVVCL